MSKKSAVKLTLTREDEKGDIVSEQVTIRKMRFRQFNRTLALVTQILEAVDENPEFRGMITEMLFGTQFDRDAAGDLPKETLDQMEAEFHQAKGNRFAVGLYRSFRTILTVLPDLALELMAVMAKIDVELMLDQEVESGFDVLDAIMEVNDIEELVVRGKQSFKLIQKTFDFMKPENQAASKEPVKGLQQ